MDNYGLEMIYSVCGDEAVLPTGMRETPGNLEPDSFQGQLMVEKPTWTVPERHGFLPSDTMADGTIVSRLDGNCKELFVVTRRRHPL
jgi:hypothetical protein